jgi:Na+-driven multidrug efflux pump
VSVLHCNHSAGGVGIAGTVLRFTVSMFAFLVASVTPIVAGTVADKDTEATSRYAVLTAAQRALYCCSISMSRFET